MSLMCGFMLQDFKNSCTICRGFGIFLGTTLQFVEIKWLRGVSVFICVFIAIFIVWKPMVSFIQSSLNQKISRSFLVDDVRQMASILETIQSKSIFNNEPNFVFMLAVSISIVFGAAKIFRFIQLAEVNKNINYTNRQPAK